MYKKLKKSQEFKANLINIFCDKELPLLNF